MKKAEITVRTTKKEVKKAKENLSKDIEKIKVKVAEKIENEITKGISGLEARKPYKTEPMTKPNKQDGDLIGLLLEQADPNLVRVLINNSSPENLDVFLGHSNITVRDMKHILEY